MSFNIGDRVQVHGVEFPFDSYNNLIGTLQEKTDGPPIRWKLVIEMPGREESDDIKNHMVMKESELRPYQRDSSLECPLEYWRSINVTHGIGARVQVPVDSPSKYSGRIGTITCILITGLRLVKFPDLDNGLATHPRKLLALASEEAEDIANKPASVANSNSVQHVTKDAASQKFEVFLIKPPHVANSNKAQNVTKELLLLGDAAGAEGHLDDHAECHLDDILRDQGDRMAGRRMSPWRARRAPSPRRRTSPTRNTCHFYPRSDCRSEADPFAREGHTECRH